MTQKDLKKNTPQPTSTEHTEEERAQERIQLVVLSLDKEEYALPIADVREVIKIPEITPIPESPDFVSGIINLRGRVIAVVDLEKRFHLKREHTDITPSYIIIIDIDDTSFGVIVDEVTEVLQIPADSIHEAPDTVRSKIGAEYIQGVAVLQEAETDISEHEKGSETEHDAERILLLLDIKQVLSEEEKRSIKNHPTVDGASHEQA